ncbi:MAG: 16S rRNA (adenine(1518)-N(6)/adenine(1519)-N(6))-dimethyltransferase RsmA [Malacoplasma sp.]
MNSNNFNFLSYIKKNKFYPSKNLGQNFLISNFYIDKITNLIEDNKNFVIEIGPGFGSLTNRLIKNCDDLLVVEFDKRLAHYLNETYPTLNLINDDALKFDFDLEFKKRKYSDSIIISNLPYCIASQIIFKFTYFNNVKEMIFMVQKELAEKLIYENGTNNNFSILLNLIFSIKKEFDVPNSVFFPIPKVVSTVLHFYRKTINFDIDKMNKFLKICFLQKRKTINNNLRKHFPSDLVDEIFNKLSYDKNWRASCFLLENYLALYNEFYEKI